VDAATHADGMLFMEYYKLWDTPLDNEAWTTVRRLREEGAFGDYATFCERVPTSSAEYGMVDRVFCSFEQAGVLMRNGLLHPALYFEGWADPARTWAVARSVVEGIRSTSGSPEPYKNFEWLARRSEQWRTEQHD
jgi:hypothetical protein